MSREELKIPAAELAVPREREVEIRASELDLKPGDAAISVWFRLRPCGDEILVDLRVTSSVPVNCASCLAPVRFELSETVSASCSISPGGEVDLAPDVRDIFMGGIPMRITCSESCRGLCAECGKNLNEGPCGCGEKRAVGPLRSLLDDALRKDPR